MDQAEKTVLCPDARLNAVVAKLQSDDQGGLAAIEVLIKSWPLDPRLHFLRGSVLAGLQRYDEGRRAMARAVEIAPDFALARFQLGFLDLTSGRALDAMAVWMPLSALPEDDALRVLSEGLASMAIDNFSRARQLLKHGMSLNTANPLINADMQMILDEIANLPDGHQVGAPEADNTAGSEPAGDDFTKNSMEASAEPAPASAVDMLLQQAQFKDGGKATRH